MVIARKFMLLGSMTIGLGLSVTAAQAATLVTSGFTTDANGWTSDDPAQVAQLGSGGNPDGYLSFVDANGDGSKVYAPSTYLGNYLTMNVSAISYDFNIFAETHVQFVSPYKIGLSGPGGSAVWVGTTPSLASLPTGWQTISATISAGKPPAGWSVGRGSWNALLANVTKLAIPIELVSNDRRQPWTDHEGIDNITLSTAIAAVPESATWMMWLAGFGLVGTTMRGRRRHRLQASPA